MPLVQRNYLPLRHIRIKSMSKIRSFWNFICRYKYIVAIIVFVAVVGFLDTNSYFNISKLKTEARQLERERDNYMLQYERDTKQLHELESSPKAMERIARERYFMKKPNEDVFIIKDN